MNHRLVAAGLFGGAAVVLFLIVCPLTGWRIAALGAALTVPVAALVAALAAPRLAADALSDEDDNGLVGGAGVTVGTYVSMCFTAAFFVLVAGGPFGAVGPGSVFEAVVIGLQMVIGIFGFGGLFLIPAFLPGLIAGWIFYHHVRAEA